MGGADSAESRKRNQSIIQALDEIVYQTRLLAFEAAWEKDHVREKVEVDDETTVPVCIRIDTRPLAPKQK